MGIRRVECAGQSFQALEVLEQPVSLHAVGWSEHLAQMPSAFRSAPSVIHLSYITYLLCSNTSQYTSVWFCSLEFPALVTLVSDKRHHQDFVSSTSVTQGFKMQQTRTQTARDWWTQRTWERHSRNAFKGSDSSQVESREMHKLSAADRVCPSKASISNWPSAWICAVKEWWACAEEDTSRWI